MPNYDFACENPSHGYTEFEAAVPLTAYDAMMAQGGVPCPLCKQMAQKMASAPGFALKGRGWHKTDYSTFGPRVR